MRDFLLFACINSHMAIYSQRADMLSILGRYIVTYAALDGLATQITGGDHEKLTFGTARSASSSISKNSSALKLNIPATMFEGNIWILLLKKST